MIFDSGLRDSDIDTCDAIAALVNAMRRLGHEAMLSGRR
jgi:hypothetical protein